MKFGRTRVIIGPSKARNHEESAGDVHFGVAAQKPRKNAGKQHFQAKKISKQNCPASKNQS